MTRGERSVCEAAAVKTIDRGAYVGLERRIKVRAAAVEVAVAAAASLMAWTMSCADGSDGAVLDDDLAPTGFLEALVAGSAAFGAAKEAAGAAGRVVTGLVATFSKAFKPCRRSFSMRCTRGSTGLTEEVFGTLAAGGLVGVGL